MSAVWTRYPAGIYRYWSTWDSEEDEAEEQVFNRDATELGIEHMLAVHAERSRESERYLDTDHPYTVRDPDGTLTHWTIRGETSVTYRATRSK